MIFPKNWQNVRSSWRGEETLNPRQKRLSVQFRYSNPVLGQRVHVLDKVSTLPRSHFWKEYMNMYSFLPRFAPAVRQRDGRGRLVSCALKTEVCRGPVELHCEGGNHARDCILVLFYSRLSLNRVFFLLKCSPLTKIWRGAARQLTRQHTPC